ncbi:MAG: hypothetical protein CSA62_00235 [Planctomycetota bacterium]|nr:MAG: hypothetical protein CSA62_00235 [Planctomycetota bacterium]
MSSLDPRYSILSALRETQAGLSCAQRRRMRKLGYGLLMGLLPRMALAMILGYWGFVLFSGREPFSPYFLPAFLGLAFLAGSLALWLRARRIVVPPERAAARVDRVFELSGRIGAALEFSQDPKEDLPGRTRAFRRLSIEDGIAALPKIAGAAPPRSHSIPRLPLHSAILALILSLVPALLRLDAAKTTTQPSEAASSAVALPQKQPNSSAQLPQKQKARPPHSRLEDDASGLRPASEASGASDDQASAKKTKATLAQAPLGASESLASRSSAEPSESSESVASPSSGASGASTGGGSAKSGKREDEGEKRKSKKAKTPRPKRKARQGAKTKEGESDASGSVPKGSSTSGGTMAAVGNKRAGVDSGEEREDDAETEDEEIEDEQEESEQRGGVMPRMRDRRPPAGRDLAISGDGPPDDGRGGPSPPKKARGTASLVLGVRLPDHVRGLPNPGTAKTSSEPVPAQERVRPRRRVLPLRSGQAASAPQRKLPGLSPEQAGRIRAFHERRRAAKPHDTKQQANGAAKQPKTGQPDESQR